MRTVKFTKRHGHKWDETGTVWLEFPVDELRRRCVDGYLDRLAGTASTLSHPNRWVTRRSVSPTMMMPRRRISTGSATRLASMRTPCPRTCWSRGSCC